MQRENRRWRMASFFLLIGILISLFFWMGLVMGEEHYRQKIVEALKAGNSLAAIQYCVEWQKEKDVTNRPLFFLAKAIVHAQNGIKNGCVHCEGVLVNLLKILED